MKIQKIGYLTSLSEDAVINCGNNHSFYKIKTLENELGDLSENSDFFISFQEQLKRNKKLDIQKASFSTDGINTEIIDPQLGKPIKGKFRITLGLEFIPDEPQNVGLIHPLMRFVEKWIKPITNNMEIRQMSNREFLNGDDVISVSDSDKIVVNHKTFKAQEFLHSVFTKWFNNDLGKRWVFEGVDCHFLVPGKNWRKGKIKISLEFIPDEVESPLDEIRREMQQDIDN